MGQRLTVELVEQALTMALVNRIPTEGSYTILTAAVSMPRRATNADSLNTASSPA